MVDNDAVDFPDNVSIRDAIAAGEIDVGLINHYYVAQAVAAEGPDYPVEVYFPPRGLGSLLLLTSVGVLESSTAKAGGIRFHPLTARRRAVSEFFTSTSKEYPLAKGAEPDPSLEVPLSEIPAPTGDLSDIAETQATIELMQETRGALMEGGAAGLEPAAGGPLSLPDPAATHAPAGGAADRRADRRRRCPAAGRLPGGDRRRRPRAGARNGDRLAHRRGARAHRRRSPPP